MIKKSNNLKSKINILKSKIERISTKSKEFANKSNYSSFPFNKESINDLKENIIEILKIIYYIMLNPFIDNLVKTIIDSVMKDSENEEFKVNPDDDLLPNEVFL